MSDVFICDAVRTPIGRYGGALSSVRTDDLGAIPMAALVERNTRLDPAVIDDISYGCANQAGEDNRNVARMSALLAGLPVSVPAATVNRLCGSGMNAIGNIADAIRAGGSAIGHVHFVDSNRQPVGRGHMRYEPIAAALKEIKYDRYASAEAFPIPDSDEAARLTMDGFKKYLAG